MTAQGWLQIVVFLVVLFALAAPLGGYMARVYTGEAVFLTRIVGPVERLVYRLIRVDPTRQHDWKRYARNLLLFSFVGWLVLFVLLRAQDVLPGNPQHFEAAPWDVTFNTTSSFVTNTIWQFYGGETTLSYVSQMTGLAVQNFLSAAVGIVVVIALIRGIVGRSGKSLGNFWVDVTRTVLYVLLPIAIVGAVALMAAGVV